MLKLNAVVAVILGIALAIGESVRRFGTEFFLPFLVDDYIMSALLIFGAWRAHRSSFKDLKFLLAGWSFTSGMLYLSFFANLEKYMSNPSSPGIAAPIWVTYRRASALANSPNFHCVRNINNWRVGHASCNEAEQRIT